MQPFPPAAATANSNALAGWMASAASSSSVQAAVVTASSLPVQPNQGQRFTLTRVCKIALFWEIKLYLKNEVTFWNFAYTIFSL